MLFQRNPLHARVPAEFAPAGDDAVARHNDRKLVRRHHGADGAGGVVGAVWHEQVRQGLVGLGWTAAQADQAVTAVAEKASGTEPVPMLLKMAIQLLGRTR